MNQSTALIQLCAGLAMRCSSSAAASCESYSLVLRQTQLFFDSSFVWFLFFPSLVFNQVKFFRLSCPKSFSQPNSFKYSSTVSALPHLIPETHSQRERALRTCTQVHNQQDMFMLQLGWESRVGSNYVCLVLLRILAAACSTFGPKGPRVERDRSFGFYSNTRHT